MRRFEVGPRQGETPAWPRVALGILLTCGLLLAMPARAGTQRQPDPAELTAIGSLVGDEPEPPDGGPPHTCPWDLCFTGKDFCPTDPDCCGGIDCIKIPISLLVADRIDPNGIWAIHQPSPGACGIERRRFWVKCGGPLLNATCN